MTSVEIVDHTDGETGVCARRLLTASFDLAVEVDPSTRGSLYIYSVIPGIGRDRIRTINIELATGSGFELVVRFNEELHAVQLNDMVFWIRSRAPLDPCLQGVLCRGRTGDLTGYVVVGAIQLEGNPDLTRHLVGGGHVARGGPIAALSCAVLHLRSARRWVVV